MVDVERCNFRHGGMRLNAKCDVEYGVVSVECCIMQAVESYDM